MASAALERFIAKWERAQLKESAAAQEHFTDLCRVLGEKTPAEADPNGEWYCFEAGTRKTAGGDGFADVWKRGYFAWEYKGKRANLGEAYLQVQQYREDLENPPLLIVCDIESFEIHTNFTGTAKKVYKFSLRELRESLNVRVLRNAFRSPEKLRPHKTATGVTEDAARQVARLAQALESRGVDPRRAAHFLMQIVFCMFAEDAELLPDRIFTQLVQKARSNPQAFAGFTKQLFAAMAKGGFVGFEEIPWFNGGLFTDDQVIPLRPHELEILDGVVELDWAPVEPAIFGTLFERGLDPDKRQQIGAHYTSPEDIRAIIEPVILDPLKAEWVAARAAADRQLARLEKARSKRTMDDAHKRAESAVGGFLERLRKVRILDPACGSGNFLYLSLRALKDLEGEVIAFAARHDLGSFLPFVSPAQLYGIEVDPYAHELAQVVVWIGHLQWAYHNSFVRYDAPILKAFENICCADAVSASPDGDDPVDWPEVDFIVGNPPFLGGKLLRTNLGDEYVDRLFARYGGPVPREADLVCYWFERARRHIAEGRARRAGLVATNSIRGGANRRVLEEINDTGGIFMAWDDRPWVLDGAAVRVSMVGFDDGSQEACTLNGAAVERIHSDLTVDFDLTVARRLPENLGIAFMGDTKGGPFDISVEQAHAMLAASNPDGRSNEDVVRPWATGQDITGRPRNRWIIDFGTDLSEDEAALYEQPFEYVRRVVRPRRTKSRSTRSEWWIHERPRIEMRRALEPLGRFIATPTVAKHRVFVLLPADLLPDHALIVFARDDWFTLGVLHALPHRVWSLRMCTWLGKGNDPRYTPTTTFETFPLPEDASWAKRTAVENAARELYEMRLSALEQDSKRTLTTLYNESPAWLEQRQQALDRAVLRAYGWPTKLGDDEIVTRLLGLNLERTERQKAMPAGARRRTRKSA